jgi:hypothetical protein
MSDTMFIVSEMDGWELNPLHIACFTRKSANKWLRDNVEDKMRGYYRVVRVSVE